MNVSQLTLDEHEELVRKLTESLLIRKMLHFISIISDRSGCLHSRLSSLDCMLQLMIDHINFFENFDCFVERTPSKMQEIRQEISTRASEHTHDLLVQVENLYKQKKNSLPSNKQ